MVTIRNWRAATPVVAHESVLGWVILKERGTPGFPQEYAPLCTIGGVAIQMMQAGREGDYHAHEDAEQLYYFTRGHGKMRLDDQLYPVREGDTVHVPPGSKHQLLNDSDDWVEHLILSAPGGTGGGQSTIRNWRDCTPVVGHESAIIWSIFRAHDAPGLPPEEAVMAGLTGFTLHLMQGRKNGDYHHHEDAEQVYYFTRGHGQMKIDGQLYPVREGDVVHTPARIKHQLLNTSDDWIEHLIITAKVTSP